MQQQHITIHIYILLFNGDIYQGFIYKKLIQSLRSQMTEENVW